MSTVAWGYWILDVKYMFKALKATDPYYIQFCHPFYEQISSTAVGGNSSLFQTELKSLCFSVF
jgi:hypothetical protein